MTTATKTPPRRASEKEDSHKMVKMYRWTPSNPATLGTSQSVLIRGVASFQGSRLEEAHYLEIPPDEWVHLHVLFRPFEPVDVT